MRKLIYILVLALIASIALNLWQWHTTPPPPATVTVHDTAWRDTTMHQPVAAETIRTSRVIKIKIPSPAHTDTLHDSILVQLPIEQRRYTDTLYTAWVSGYNPALDSITNTPARNNTHHHAHDSKPSTTLWRRNTGGCWLWHNNTPPRHLYRYWRKHTPLVTKAAISLI